MSGHVIPARMISCPECGKRHIIAAPILAPFECKCGRRIDPFHPEGSP